MPVKIRCRGCEKVLNAPDKARGRVIKCPQCGTKLKVPGDQQSTSKRPAKTQTKARDSDDFLAGLDLSRVESEEEKVCPFCAAEMDPDAVICRACGMNIQTGTMDRREAKRRARRGPDPALFYKKAWTDSWEFLRSHWKLAMRTGIYWALFAVLVNMCSFMFVYSRTGPPKFFWICMTFLSALGLAGWYWFLTLKIIESTMDRDEKLLEYIHFDLFQSVALGLRAFMWPFVMYIPFYPVLVPLAFFLGVAAAIASGGGGTGVSIVFVLIALGLSVFPALVYPLALIHMTQRYTYKAWILWEMLIVAVKNLGASLYFWVVGLVLMLPVVLMVFVPMILLLGPESGGNLFFSPRVVGISQADVMAYNAAVNSALAKDQSAPDRPRQVDGWTEQAVAWCLNAIGEQPSPDGWLFRVLHVSVNLLLAFLLYIPAYLILAFPAVFMMKVNGLLGYYNREQLGLVNQIPENTPANFWVRVLAHLVDLCLWPFATLLVIKEKRALALGWVVNAIVFLMAMFLPESLAWMLPLVGVPMFVNYDYWMYFTVSEASATRTTIGKDAFGLVVNDLNNKQITMGKGSKRWLGRLVCGMTFGLGYLMVAFHPEKRGLHDLIAGTRCCWRGDR